MKSKCINRFKDKGIKPGGIYMFNSTDAIEIIEYCKKQKVAILGIDALRIFDGKTQPQMDHSVDYTDSRHNHDREYWDEAIEFLKEHQAPDRYFEIVIRE